MASEYGWLAFYGENFRTNVHLLGSFPFGPNDKAEIVSQLKADFVRLSDNVQRQPIDIRIKSLNLYCDGFLAPIDFTHEACKHYHTLMNERNDLLHGNVVVEKLRFNEVYFQGRVPIFNEYRSFWQRTIGLDAQAVGLGKVLLELEVVDDFIAYLLSTLTPAKRRFIELIAMKRDLGQNEEDGRLGILFPDHLVDARMGGSVTNSEAHPETSD